ncbi:hypothetical protein AB0J72_40785 [Dactylosporangium sp. NPDC049742]|uniref:hypothetical protein n=1 Tax=Dactylosporangium sp. NPDC049742 TaxID=3154737 RepID=UPI003426CA09
MDGLTRARTPGWVVGVLALVLAMLFGATVGSPASHAGIVHQLLTSSPVPFAVGHHHHESSSDGDEDDERQPLMLHAEGEQVVDTPEVAAHQAAQLTTGVIAQLMPASGVEPSAGAETGHAPARAALQVWRT